MNISNKTLLISSLALGAVALTSPALIAAQTASGSATPANCIATDVKGSLNYSGDHESGNPVTGFMENVGTDQNCNDKVYVHVFGTNNITPHVGDWLTSQVYITTETFTIPAGTNQNITVNVPSSDYCWYQVDATRTADVRVPPIYNGDDMIDYVLIKNRACGETTPTPTPTSAPTPTPTPGGNGGGGSSSNDTPKTVESIQATMATTKMAPTGNFLTDLMNVVFGSGMMISALGAVSYAKDKKAKLS